VVVIDGLVAGRGFHGAHDCVGRVFAEGKPFGVVRSSEVPVHGLPHEPREWDAPAPGAVLQLTVRGLGESKVRRDVSRHDDTRISRYRIEHTC
jgi:hypothetical protein